VVPATGLPMSLAERRRPLSRWRPSTVRWQVTVLATVAVAAVLLASSTGLIVLQRGLLTRGVDEALRQRADNLQTELFSAAAATPLRGEGDPEDSFLQLLDTAGAVIASTPNADGLPAAASVPLSGRSQTIKTVHGIRISGGDFRVLARRLDRAPGSPTLLVGKNLDDVQESVRILAVSLVVSVPVVVIVLALVVWRLVGRVLRPVESVRHEVASIRGDQLHRRVPVPQSRDEIARLAQTMNAMLDRVEQSTRRQRDFVADASHELRGPLTRLRSELEVALAHPVTVDQATLQHTLLDGVVELQQLVEDLLFLARSDSGSAGGPTRPVDLDDLVLLEAKQVLRRGRVHVNTSAVSAARTMGDARQLARAIGNLASNAERHARAVVSFEVRERADRSEVVVADDGPGIPVDQRAAVFRRFTRLDHARSRDAGGVGLGLAIAQDIAVRHAGEITVESVDGGGARFVMTLPRCD